MRMEDGMTDYMRDGSILVAGGGSDDRDIHSMGWRKSHSSSNYIRVAFPRRQGCLMVILLPVLEVDFGGR